MKSHAVLVRITLALHTSIGAEVTLEPLYLDQGGEGDICQALKIYINAPWGGGQARVKFIVKNAFRLHSENVKI